MLNNARLLLEVQSKLLSMLCGSVQRAGNELGRCGKRYCPWVGCALKGAHVSKEPSRDFGSLGEQGAPTLLPLLSSPCCPVPAILPPLRSCFCSHAPAVLPLPLISRPCSGVQLLP